MRRLATDTYVPPTRGVDAFNCPLCGAYARQHWAALGTMGTSAFNKYDDFETSWCSRCNKTVVWQGGRILYPPVTTVPPPSRDMPDEAREVYAEAASIIDLSPRAAAALMRLCVQHLCAFLGQKGDLNEAIGALVKDGLTPRVQKALDVIRVTGNQAIHPGTIDISDDRDRAASMFQLVNGITEALISHPKRLDALYEDLPETVKERIAKRDGTA